MKKFSEDNTIVKKAISKNIIQVIFVFQEDVKLNMAVPKGIESVNNKERKLLVWAKILDGKFVNKSELIFGLTFPDKYVANASITIPIKGVGLNKFEIATSRKMTELILTNFPIDSLEK